MHLLSQGLQLDAQEMCINWMLSKCAKESDTEKGWAAAMHGFQCCDISCQQSATLLSATFAKGHSQLDAT